MIEDNNHIGVTAYLFQRHDQISTDAREDLAIMPVGLVDLAEQGNARVLLHSVNAGGKVYHQGGVIVYQLKPKEEAG